MSRRMAVFGPTMAMLAPNPMTDEQVKARTVDVPEPVRGKRPLTLSPIKGDARAIAAAEAKRARKKAKRASA